MLLIACFMCEILYYGQVTASLRRLEWLWIAIGLPSDCHWNAIGIAIGLLSDCLRIAPYMPCTSSTPSLSSRPSSETRCTCTVASSSPTTAGDLPPSPALSHLLPRCPTFSRLLTPSPAFSPALIFTDDGSGRKDVDVIGKVPNRKPIDDVAGWVLALNEWKQQQLEDYAKQPTGTSNR